MKRVAHYVRVSHEEQVRNGISIDAQISALEAYSSANNYKVVKVYVDEGISARKSYKKRPALLEMISDCQQGKIDLILICKLDRFFRSVPDYYAVMEQIGNIPWKAIQEDYETETSAGVFKVNIMLSVAQSEADRASERVKAVFDYKRQKGEALTGSTATGYKYVDGKWIKDPDEQKGVEAFFETYLTTFNKHLAIANADELGVHISDETARHMLYSDRYHGVVPYIEGAYITPEQHELILAHKPACFRQNKYSYIFSGLVKCGKCGRPLSAQTSVEKRKNNKVYKYPLYVCDYGRRNYKCTGSMIPEKRLEEVMLGKIEKELNEFNIKVTMENEKTSADSIRKYEDRLDRIKVLFEMGDISIEEYKVKRTELLEQISKLKSARKEPIHLDSDWRSIYAQLDIKHKNSFWRNIIDRIEVPERSAKDVIIKFR